MGEGMGGPGPEQMMTPMERIRAAKEYGKEMDKVTSVGDALSAVAITEGMIKIVEALYKKDPNSSLASEIGREINDLASRSGGEGLADLHAVIRNEDGPSLKVMVTSNDKNSVRANVHASYFGGIRTDALDAELPNWREIAGVNIAPIDQSPAPEAKPEN